MKKFKWLIQITKYKENHHIIIYAIFSVLYVCCVYGLTLENTHNSNHISWQWIKQGHR